MTTGIMSGGLTRRWFIGGLTGLGATAGRGLFASPGAASRSGARLKIGVLSDVHLNKPGDETTFLKALAYFRDHGADGVLIAGDIADSGRAEQLKRCADCWYRTFPDGKAPDGRPVWFARERRRNGRRLAPLPAGGMTVPRSARHSAANMGGTAELSVP